eukprot:1142855-Pelagomonas_calceolata.AAC.2
MLWHQEQKVEGPGYQKLWKLVSLGAIASQRRPGHHADRHGWRVSQRHLSPLSERLRPLLGDVSFNHDKRLSETPEFIIAHHTSEASLTASQKHLRPLSGNVSFYHHKSLSETPDFSPLTTPQRHLSPPSERLRPLPGDVSFFHLRSSQRHLSSSPTPHPSEASLTTSQRRLRPLHHKSLSKTADFIILSFNTGTHDRGRGCAISWSFASTFSAFQLVGASRSESLRTEEEIKHLHILQKEKAAAIQEQLWTIEEKRLGIQERRLTYQLEQEEQMAGGQKEKAGEIKQQLWMIEERKLAIQEERLKLHLQQEA